MAANSPTTRTQIASIVEQKWRPEFGLVANEERAVTAHFSMADGVKAIGDTLNLSKISTVSAQTLSATGTPTRPDLNYSQNTELNVTVQPNRYYAGVQISRVVNTRLLRFDAYMAGLKKQLMSALMAQVDVLGAGLLNALTTSVVGSGADDITQALLAAAIGKLATNAKEKFKVGQTNAYVVLHPSQVDDLLSIPNFMSANVRGDAEDPTVKGWVVKALGCEINESGNILASGGVAYNLCHIPDSHVLGYNEEATILPEQMNGLATVVIATVEVAAVEFFDEYAVSLQTRPS